MTLIHTDRLALRHLTEKDSDFILALLNSPGFIENIGDRGVRTVEQALAYIVNGPIQSYEEHGFGLYLVTLLATGEPIGVCGLIKRPALDYADIGYAFMPVFFGKGFATEACQGVLNYAHTLGFDIVAAIVSRHNMASKAVLTKLGFRLLRPWLMPGETVEVDYYELNLTS